MVAYLDFESEIKSIDEKIRDLKKFSEDKGIELGDEIEKQFHDISNYCRGKCHNPLGKNRMETNPKFIFNYDIDKWLDETLDTSLLDQFKLSKQLKLTFTLTDEQFQIIHDNVELFGHTTVGYTRALKHVHERIFWRNPKVIQ